MVIRSQKNQITLCTLKLLEQIRNSWILMLKTTPPPYVNMTIKKKKK